MRYAVVIEKASTGYGAYVLDLPGCVAAAESEEEIRELIREAIELHLRALQEEGSDIPPPSTIVEYVEVSAAA
jgi:predicted RNase H-like HicB family nuclease